MMTERELLDLLEKAIQIAVSAHAGQVDLHGEPYILHPLRVMHKLSSVKDRTVAILHDVVEDSDWTLFKLAEEGFPEDLLATLAKLTKSRGENYLESYIPRIKDDPRARRVKLADLDDNTDMTRLYLKSELDAKRLAKYHTAIQILKFE